MLAMIIPCCKTEGEICSRRRNVPDQLPQSRHYYFSMSFSACQMQCEIYVNGRVTQSQMQNYQSTP